MMDNTDIAIMTRVNELAERHGFRPYEFHAVVRPEERNAENPNMVLSFEVPYSGNKARESAFYKMLDGLGVEETTGKLFGTDKQIIEALDGALAVAPRLRQR